MAKLRRGAAIKTARIKGACRLKSLPPRCPLCLAIIEGKASIVSLLIDAARTADDDYILGQALWTAVTEWRNEFLEPLLQAGADPGHDEDRGGTPMLCAASRRNTVAASRLIQAGINLSWANVDSDTALSLAAMFGHIHTLRVIVDAEPSLQDERKRDRLLHALHGAIYGDHTDVVKLLMERSPGSDGDFEAEKIAIGLDRALSVKKEKIVQFFLEFEAARFAQRMGGGFATALRSAAEWNYMEAARILVDNFKTSDYLDCEAESGGTALCTAVRYGELHPGPVRILLDAGADASFKGANGPTPLHHAAEHGCPTAAQALLNHGAALDARDSRGYTPVHAAVHWDRDELVEMFIAAGADISLKDNEGLTPVELALKHNNQVIADILTSTGAVYLVAAEDDPNGG